jgi:hypothetical protein
MPSIRKMMLTVFWDRQQPFLLYFMPRGVAINTDSHCGTLTLLQSAFRKKCPGILVDNVVLLHDARRHVANRTAAQLQSFRREIMEHAAYSPDLTPSDNHVFDPLNKFLASQRFISDVDAKNRCLAAVLHSTNRIL